MRRKFLLFSQLVKVYCGWKLRFSTIEFKIVVKKFIVLVGGWQGKKEESDWLIEPSISQWRRKGIQLFYAWARGNTLVLFLVSTLLCNFSDTLCHMICLPSLVPSEDFQALIMLTCSVVADAGLQCSWRSDKNVTSCTWNSMFCLFQWHSILQGNGNSFILGRKCRVLLF